MDLSQLLLEYQQASHVCLEERVEGKRLRQTLQHLERAQEIAQVVAEKVQTEVHTKIAAIVTKCLAIFDSPYTFHIQFRKSRGKTEARMVFQQGNMEVDPISASGGGVVSVAAFALRLAAVVLQPGVRKVLVLDEPFGHLSREYTQDIAEVLQALSEEVGIQIILVTHNQNLDIGRMHHI